MSNIPAARQLLRDVLPTLPATAAAIRAYCARHPDADLQDVAHRFGVNIGRVSEALHGRR